MPLNKKDLSATAYLFLDMLKMKRREMKPYERKRKVVTGNINWLYPFAYERQYRNYLYELMDIFQQVSFPTIQNNLQRWIDEQKADSFDDDLRKDDFNTEFQRLISRLERDHYNIFDEEGKGVERYNKVTITAFLVGMGYDVSNFNEDQWIKYTKKVLGQPFLPHEAWLSTTISTWGDANFGLIKSLSGEYIKKLNFIVSDGVLEGRTYNAIMKDLRSMNKNMTRYRALLLARDQVGKLNGLLSKRRMQSAGVEVYTWRTAMDERVRSSHKPLNGKLCRWDNDSVYSDDGGKTWKSRSSIRAYEGTPGQDIQCRCAGIPVWDEMINLADKELKKEAI